MAEVQFKSKLPIIIMDFTRIYLFLKDISLRKGIFSLSVCSYGIFLVHKFPIWIFEIIDKTLHIYSRNPFKWEPLMFIIVLLFSWGLYWFYPKYLILRKSAPPIFRLKLNIFIYKLFFMDSFNKINIDFITQRDNILNISD